MCLALAAILNSDMWPEKYKLNIKTILILTSTLKRIIDGAKQTPRGNESPSKDNNLWPVNGDS